MRSVRLLSGGLLLVALMFVAETRSSSAKAGQISVPGQQQIPQPNSSGVPNRTHTADEDPDPLKDRMEAQRAKMLVSERRKKMAADTDKLLQLATELKAEMDKTTKDEMSLSVIKKAGDIEKLAHDVKERMKG